MTYSYVFYVSLLAKNSVDRREYSVVGFLSSRPNWVPPPPCPQASITPPTPFGSKKRDTLACGGGVGGPNSDEGTDTLVLYVYYNPSRICPLHSSYVAPSTLFPARLASRGLQRYVVYLGWPIAPSCMSPNAGRGGDMGSQPMRIAVDRSPNKVWRSNSIFNLC